MTEIHCLRGKRLDTDSLIFGSAAYCRAFGAEDRHAASASAARLARDPQVRARIVWLRERSVEEMGVDRAWILAKRRKIDSLSLLMLKKEKIPKWNGSN